MNDPFGCGLAEDQHRRCAAALFNGVWSLLEKTDREAADDEVMINAAHASRWHWDVVGTPLNWARGEWQISRVYAVLGCATQAREHAERYLAMCDEHDLPEFDRAFAHESIARAASVAGDSETVAAHLQYGMAAAEAIEADDDRRWVRKNLGTVTADPPKSE